MQKIIFFFLFSILLNENTFAQQSSCIGCDPSIEENCKKYIIKLAKKVMLLSGEQKIMQYIISKKQEIKKLKKQEGGWITIKCSVLIDTKGNIIQVKPSEPKFPIQGDTNNKFVSLIQNHLLAYLKFTPFSYKKKYKSRKIMEISLWLTVKDNEFSFLLTNDILYSSNRNAMEFRCSDRLLFEKVSKW